MKLSLDEPYIGVSRFWLNHGTRLILKAREYLFVDVVLNFQRSYFPTRVIYYLTSFAGQVPRSSKFSVSKAVKSARRLIIHPLGFSRHFYFEIQTSLHFYSFLLVAGMTKNLSPNGETQLIITLKKNKKVLNDC